MIIAGRRRGPRDETVAANPGMAGMALDIEDADAIASFAAQVVKDHPALNVVINNAGIMKPEKLSDGSADLRLAAQIVATNLLGPIRLTTALMPHLCRQPKATVMTVSSGLAFVPLAFTPTYCATKAAIHSWTQSLRYQLRDTNVQVQELIPPYVQTDLMDGAEDPRAMPLKEFIAEVMQILKDKPDAEEIAVERVFMLRNAERENRHDQTFKMLNEAMADRH